MGKEKVVGVAFVFVLSVVVWSESIVINRNIYIFKTCVEHLGKRSVVKRRGRGRGARGEMGLKDASAYWRLAGMSYLKYANLCAEMTRAALKQGLRDKAKAREAITFKQTPFKDGKPQQTILTDNTGT